MSNPRKHDSSEEINVPATQSSSEKKKDLSEIALTLWIKLTNHTGLQEHIITHPELIEELAIGEEFVTIPTIAWKQICEIPEVEELLYEDHDDNESNIVAADLPIANFDFDSDFDEPQAKKEKNRTRLIHIYLTGCSPRKLRYRK